MGRGKKMTISRHADFEVLLNNQEGTEDTWISSPGEGMELNEGLDSGIISK